MARRPDCPWSSRFQTFSAPIPSGVTSPMPVTTTRFMRCYRMTLVRARPALLVRLDEADRILDGHDLLGRIVRNLASELLLERHHQLDRVEAVGSEIIDEAGVVRHLGLVDAKMLHHNLFYSLGDIAHRFVPRRKNGLVEWTFGATADPQAGLVPTVAA